MVHCSQQPRTSTTAGMDSRPETPFYYFNDGEAASTAAGTDPPPSYSSTGSPSTTDSSTSSSRDNSPRTSNDVHGLRDDARSAPGDPLTASSSSLGGVTASASSRAGSVSMDEDEAERSRMRMRMLLEGELFNNAGSSISSSIGNGTTAGSSYTSENGSDNGLSTSSLAEGETTATNLLSRNGGTSNALRTEGSMIFGSRLHSRAVSPAPPMAMSKLEKGGSATASSSGIASSSSASRTGVQHHIHHHYHHNSASSTASTATSAPASLRGSPNGKLGVLSSGPISSSIVRSLSSLSNKAGIDSKGKGRDSFSTSSSSTDYGPPNDGYFNSAYHYRTGPMARKLGSTVLSREPSFTDLPQMISSSGMPSPAISSSGSTSHRRRSGWKSPKRRHGNSNDLFSDDNGGGLGGLFGAHTSTASLLDTSTSYRNRRRFSALVPLSVQRLWQRILRHPLCPTQPITILFGLGLFACFAFSVTTLIYHILSTDKAPRPWRAYCQEQGPFPHELADSLAPVDVFVGVFSVDAAYERRHLIRSTYLRHSKPIDPYTGQPGHNIQVKFILGRPRKHHARRIALEMETYDDIVVLDMKENMNRGKTHAFFRWANENATVPIFYKPPQGKKIGRLGSPSTIGDGEENLNLGFKKADYVVKADDDSFLVLSELERHLRVAPRKGAYWGYLIRNLFMGGECYALSSDLVNYVATTPALEAYASGAEDKRVAKWMRMHPNASSINWITERCYVYDHPKAATTYSHGFLFPDEVERVRAEGLTGISPPERQRRGGDLADAWSTVSRWKKSYVKPKNEMTMEEEVEALVEGGGRWSALDGWTQKYTQKDLVKWDQMVFDSTDDRIKGSHETARRADQARAEHNLKSEMAFGKYNRMPNSLLRDPGDTDIRPQHAKRSLPFWRRFTEDDPDALTTAEADLARSLSASAPVLSKDLTANVSRSEEAHAPQGPPQIPIGNAPHFKQGYSFLPDYSVNTDAVKHKAIPAPTLRYSAATVSLRERRFLGLPYGGTVVVHYLKRNEWFLETALALLGREKMWDTGFTAPAYPAYIPQNPPGGTPGGAQPGQYRHKDANISPIPTWNGRTGEVELVSSQWGGARMYGSPLIKDNGFVSLGRTVPWDALQKTQEEFGKLRGTPGQRYAELPGAPAPIKGDSSADSPVSSYSLGSTEEFPLPSSSSAQSDGSYSTISRFHEHPFSSSSLLSTSPLLDSEDTHRQSALQDDSTSSLRATTSTTLPASSNNNDNELHFQTPGNDILYRE